MTIPYIPLRWLMALAVCCALVFVFDHTSAQQGEVTSRWSPQGAAGGDPIVASFEARPAGLDLAGESVPLSLEGDVGFNVRSALDASGGALRDVTIAPGAAWSFNEAVGDPAGVPIRTVGGVPGGGWCDLASRYVQALRPVLPSEAIAFPNHIALTGIGLADVAPQDAVAIWNIDGSAGSHGGRQDLVVTNTLPHTLRLQVVEEAGGVVVRAMIVR